MHHLVRSLRPIRVTRSETSRRLVPAAVLALLAVATVASAYDLPADLRRDVDRLIADVRAAPTDAATANERMATLWRWANAVSLADGFVPKNLSLVAVYVPNPTPGTARNPAFVAAIDGYVRQLAWLDRDPRALGEVSVDGDATYEAGSNATITVRLRVGSLGIAEGGGIVISNHAMGGYGRLQITDPAAANYVSVTSDGSPSVRFEPDQAPIWGPYGGFRGPTPFPMVRVRGGALEAGDTVTLTYGDRAGGGPGLAIGVFSNDAIALPLHVDPGDGSLYEMPPATFRVTGGPAARVHGFAPSIAMPGESIVISVRTEDRWYNRATREFPALEVLRDGEVTGSLPAGEAIHLLPVTLDAEGVYRYTFRSADGAVVGEANPIWVRAAPAQRIFWGETHGHCGFAEGQGTPEGFFRFARDDARLDFVTLSEHDIWLTDGKWRHLNDNAKQFHREGELIVFPGYEWSSPRQRGGHHNVFFRHPGKERVGVQLAPDLTLLYRQLRATHDPADVLIIPHAHQAGDWRLSDLDMETLIEIMSSHGTFEWFGQRYLDSGFRVGFVGASDDHLGHPGYAPGHPSNPRRRSNIFQFGGLAGALATEKNTDAIFDALKAKHAYAVTGSQRIILDARLNGAVMGTQLERSESREVEGRVIGTAPIRRIDLIKNGDVAATHDLGRTGAANGQTELVIGFYSESWVPFRDNPRGHRTWKGTVAIEGAKPLAARWLGTPHHTADRLELDGNEIAFDVATRGARRTFLLTLEGASAATRLRFALEASREQGTAPTQVRAPSRFPATAFALAFPAGADPVEHALKTGAYRDVVSVEPAVLEDDVSFRFSDRGEPGDWYYVRVEQIDGHLAWSSPWWVGGEPPR